MDYKIINEDTYYRKEIFRHFSEDCKCSTPMTASYDSINPTQYVFHDDTETCTPVYTTYNEDYNIFYKSALEDVERAKQTREYGLDMTNHPNWFDASYIS